MTSARALREIGREHAGRILGTLTLARLLLVPVLVTTFMVDPVITTAALVVFMAADLFDGILARKLRADGLGRRALDSVVDRIAIDACLISAYFVAALPLALLCAFIARDIYLTLICAHLMNQRRVAIKADIVHRSLSVLFAVWAVAAPLLSSSARDAFAGLVLAVAIGVGMDLARAAHVVLTAPADVRDRLLVARSLREYAANEDGPGMQQLAFAPVAPAT